MKNLKKIIIGAVSGAIVAFLFTAFPAHAAIYPAQLTQYQVIGSGATSGDTTLTLNSFNDIDGNALTMSKFGTIGFGTIEPNNGSQEESIYFTGVTTNSNGTVALTGVHDVGFLYPFTITSGITKNHAGGVTFVVSNTSYFYYRMFSILDNDETITGSWLFPTPTNGSNAATKTYVDNLVNGGTVSTDRVVVAATAGESVATGTVLYLKQSDALWYKASVSIPEASSTILGIAQGSATVGLGINGGVLTTGLDANQSSLTPGRNYFLSSVSGVITVSTSTRYIGRAKSATSLYFDTYSANIPFLSGPNSFTGNNSFTTGTSTFATSSINIGAFPAYQIGKNIKIFSSTGTTTFNVPSGVTKLSVRVWGAGGGGGTSSGSSGGAAAGGGGQGGYTEAIVDVTGSSTIQVFVGTHGIAGTGATTNGTAGGWSTFGTNGSYLYATGGSGGFSRNGGGVASSTPGGMGFLGDLNQGGEPGQPGSGTGTAAGAGGNGGGPGAGYSGACPSSGVATLSFNAGGGGSCGVSGDSRNGSDGGDGRVSISW